VIRLDLPMPPSVNALFSNAPGRGRVKTKAYRQWIEAAGWEVLRQGRPNQPVGKYELWAALKKPRAGCDIDNRIKPIADLLQKQRVIQDDKHCTSVCIWWADDLPEGVACRVWIWPEEASS